MAFSKTRAKADGLRTYKGGWNNSGGWSNNGKGEGYNSKSNDGKGDKGKSKGQPKGKGKTKDPNACICGKLGHWGNECWMNKGRVQNVSEDYATTTVPSSASSTVASATTTASVRRVFNLTADEHAPETSIFTIAESESEGESL